MNPYTFYPVLSLFSLSILMMIKQLTSNSYFLAITNDAYTYTSWAWQFHEALKEGIIYSRWIGLDFWGYGAPVFILYLPLAFYITAFFNSFTDSTTVAMNYTKLFSLFLSGIGMFFLVREFYSDRIVLLSACLYAVFPYNMFELYVIGTFPSMISLLMGIGFLVSAAYLLPVIFERTFIFPGWTTTIDSTQTNITTESGSGAILLTIPEGAHLVDLRFKDTPVRYYAKLMTLFSLILIIVFSVSGVIRRVVKKN